MLSQIDINILMDSLWYHKNSQSILESKIIKYWSSEQRDLLQQKLLPLTFSGLTMSLLQEMRLIEPLNYVLPTTNEITDQKRLLRKCLLECFDPKITNHGISLSFQSFIRSYLNSWIRKSTFFINLCYRG